MYNTYISVIVPCYNEEEVIQATNAELQKVLSGSFRKYEIVYVNDGSKDNTLAELKKAKEQFSNIKIISFSRNFGHEAATSCGINECSGDYAVIIDADLQDPPDLIPDMLRQSIEENANVVYGVRKKRKGETLFKKLTSKLFYRSLNALSDVSIPLDTGDFRLIDRKVIDSFKQLKEKNKYIRGLISWVGFKQVPFYYTRHARFAGETHYSVFKLVKLAVSSTIYFSKKPLTLAINMGLFFVIISFLFMLYLITQKILYPGYILSGWTSVICIIIFFGGIILFSVGVVGMYLGNMFDEIKQRPEYIIHEFYD